MLPYLKLLSYSPCFSPPTSHYTTPLLLLKTGAFSAVLCGACQVLFVGGAALSDKGGEASTSRRDGLTAWRVLSDAPHYKLLTDIDSDQSLVSN